MTIGEAIRRVDEQKPNNISRSAKVAWLNEVDWAIYRELVRTHEGGEGKDFNGYGDGVQDSELLLATCPYDRMYVEYLAANIDLQNNEYDFYQNDMAAYNNTYTEYAKYYNRMVRPLPGPALRAASWEGMR